jgi:hypothetical protein
MTCYLDKKFCLESNYQLKQAELTAKDFKVVLKIARTEQKTPN